MRATEHGRIWIGSIVIDCTDLDRMIAFWREALHYVPRGPQRPDGVILKDPNGHGPNLNLSLTSEGRLNDYRLHLDLYASNPITEVDRLIRLGATLERPAAPGHDFVTLADPDGNLFDIIDINWPDDATDWWFGKSPQKASGPSGRMGSSRPEKASGTQGTSPSE